MEGLRALFAPAIDTHHSRPPPTSALRRPAALGPDPGRRPPPTPASSETVGQSKKEHWVIE